ncbi:hypothetical protein HZY97_00005, partial [Sphingomonas sp. R-74633]|uniref:hypothetical protein n=1 Tax=Sphingomonas sp. R-74633 TaxID=2751188 RepID=UPI0015D24DBD
MIDRGNGVRASKSASVRVGREALLRKALLGSTALIGIGLVATPAAAQTIVSPAGGGTISRNGPSNPTVNNQTGSGGGVLVTNLAGDTGITVTGVTIANTTGSPPNENALDIRSSTSGLNSIGVIFAGTNNLSTTVSGGSGYYQQTNANEALTFQSGGSTFTGSYGLTIAAPAGYATLDSTGFNQSFVGNGTAVAGINIVTAVNADIRIGGSSITGFATGVNAQNYYGTGFISTGGTINATSVGMRFTATGGGSVVNSQSAITAPTGILSNDVTGSTITTSGNGTINAASAGNGTGISVSSTGSGVTTVNVGAAIGNTTAFGTGVSLTTGNPSTATLNVTTTAAITAATYGLYLQAWAPAGRGTIDIGANITAGTAISNSGGVYDYIIRSGAVVTSTAAGASALSSGNSTSTLNNAGTLRATGAGAAGFQGFGIQTITNSGTIDGAAQGISMVNTTTINNTGTIQGGTAGGIQGSIGTVNNTGAGALITGNTGITSTGNPLTLVNSGTVSGTTWGIVSGGSTTNITSSGTISGTTGAIQLNATGTQSVNLQAGSTTTGNITATNNGTRTIAVAGTLAGGYDATGGANTAVDNFTLNAGGSVSGAIALGDGNDSFSYLGGTLGSTVDGGAGTDGFFVNIGSSNNATLDQANFTNFESFYLTTGNLTLTGSRSGGAGWTVSGGNATTFILNGSLTNITGVGVTLTTPDLMFVQSGAQLSATGDVIYSSGTGNNIQNSGTITSGTGLSTGIAIGSGTVDNYGTITYAAGGAITTQGNGILASSNQLSLSNHTGATLVGRWDGARANNGAYVVNDGLIRGDRFAGVEITGTSIVFNNATGRIYGATGEGAGLLINSGAVQVTNAGQIVGTGTAGIYNGGAGLLSVSNSGTIAVGTLDGSNNYVTGGSTTAIRSGSASITNSGLIEGPAGGIITSGALTLVNTGTINGFGIGTPNYDGVNVGGLSNILNAGTISQGTYAAIYMNGGGTVTNAAGGTLAGGNGGIGGVAVGIGGVGGTFNNYGTATSAGGNGVTVGNAGATINLFAGSTTGNITGGSGNDILAIYTGQTNPGAITQSYPDAVTGATGTVTLQNSGTLAAAAFGAVDLGTGNDTLQLRGTGTGAQQGEFALATSTGAETITKLDSGIWRLSGAAAVSGITVNSNGGTLLFQGTSGIGTINANGGIVRANGAGAFGSAVVHLLSSNVQFAASGAYANNFVLDVPAVLNGQPAVFENLFGGNAILSGSITSGSGTNAAGQAIGTSQAVTFTGIANSLFNLTGTGNSWTGITTIDLGVTVRGSTSAISGGSITNNGTLTYVQSGASSSGTVISGTGALRVEGGQVTLTGFNTYTGGTTVAGGSLQVGNGGSNGRITGAISVDAGGTLIFNRNDNYDFTSAISGAGNVQALGTVSLSGAITNTGTLTVDSATGGQVTLTGSRSGAAVSAVTLAGAGNVLRVGLTGSVAGGQYLGVRLGGVGDGVDNFGSITNTGTGGDSGYGAGIGVVATSGTTTINNGSVNNSTATISGQNGGINHVASGGVVATGLLTVNNYGLISGNLYNAIENQGGSGALTVTNNATGRIIGQGNAGGGNGIGMGGSAALTLTNSGLIVGRSNGVATGSTVNITNSGTIAAGTLSGGTSGSLVAGGGNGIQAAGGSINNQFGGVIRGSFLGGSGSDTNAITSTAALTVINSGQILGVALGSNSTVRTNGVYTSGGAGTITNNAGGQITGGWDGVFLTAGGSVTNSGAIAGNQYFGVEAATTITNNSSGRIFGFSGGATLQAGGTLNNSGLVAAATYNSTADSYTLSSGTAVSMSSGTVVNQFGATITGASGISATGALQLGNGGTITATTGTGLSVSGTGQVLTNDGTISGGSSTTQGYGVSFNSGAAGSLTSRSGALITGTPAGVWVNTTGNVSIDNGGRIVGTAAGSRGVYFQNGNATITNQSDGQIIGQGWGVLSATTANINNSGFIGAGTLSGGTSGGFTENASGNGVVFNGGFLNNGAGATIVGGNYGVASGGMTATTVNNSGTITGGTYAIYMAGLNTNDTVNLFSGSVTNGAIALGNGDDTLNWYGGSFTSIDAGTGRDQFTASVFAPTTLDLSTLTGFESHSLNGGDTLTLTGTQLATDGGWNVTGSNLVVGGSATLEMTGTGVTLNDAGASLTVNAGGQLIAHDAYAVAAYAGGSVTNAGLIKSAGSGFDGVITNGGTVDNQAGGRIIAAGNGVTLQAYGTTLTNAGVIAGEVNGVVGSDAYQTVNNTGVIVAGTAGDNATAYWQTNANLNTGDGVHFTAGGAVTNVGGYVNGNTTGIIVGGANGVNISGGAATIENSGTLQGNSGYGIAIDTAGGVTSTITNHNGGSLVGGTGAALLSGDGTVNMTNETGSYMYGGIVSTGNGTRNIDLSGVVYGNYDASSGAGIDNVVLRGGSIYGANLGDGDDSFTYIGGNILGLVDGGAGNDKLFADFGAGSSYNVSLSNFTGFESIGLVSGDMYLTGPVSDPNQAIYAGVGGMPAGTITFDGTGALTGDIYVNGGSIRANTAGAFGTGTIHMIDPTATFGATGTYANNISLEVVTPSSANPSTLNADAGVIATLTGAITTSGAAGVDPTQDLVIGGQGTIVLTNTANNWLGSTTINSGATLQGASDTISGSAIVNNGTLAYQQAYSGTVSQDISGNGFVNVSGLATGNVLTFAGTNSFNGSIVIADASNVAISGATNTGSATSVDLGNGASSLTVTATGSLTSSTSAVSGSGAGQSVFNLGAITGNGDAIFMTGANALVDNSGSITGNRALSTNSTNAQLINRAGGTLTGNAYQTVYLGNGGTIDNSGTIQSLAGSQAIYAGNGVAAITNNAGGLITSAGTVIAAYGAGSSVTNAGSITSTGDTAVYLGGGGTVTNSGSITANGNGVGVWTSAGGTFTNQSGGTITGGYAGMYLDSADLITVNLEAGSTTDRIFSFGNGDRAINIAGTLNGGYYGGAGADAIMLDTSATVSGTLDGGAGVNTLALTGTGTATLGAISNIASATKSGTGTWTLSSTTDVTAWTVNGGTLAASGGSAISDTALVTVAAPGTFQLLNDEAIGNLAGTGTVDLGANAIAITSGTSSFGGTITGNGGGLVIFSGAGLTLSGANSYTGFTNVGGTLTLGASNVLADASALTVQAGGTLDLQGNSDTVAIAVLRGTLNGTGTLTATEYDLNDAVVNGNLGAGTLFQLGGTSVLNGTSAATDVQVQAGTLALGGSDRLANNAAVLVLSGATLDLGAFNDTVGTAAIAGTLNGTGTLTAAAIQLDGAVVNGNVAGTLINASGTSVLNGTSAGNVSVNVGTLRLGAANRLADTATVVVASGATLDLATFNDTIGTLGLNGTLAGTGTLTASQYQLTGATVDANLGTGTVFNLGGTSALNGNAAGGLVVQAGTLVLNGTEGGDVAVAGGTLALGGSNRLADTALVTASTGATLDIGAFNDTVGTLGLSGTLAGTGTLTASQYQLTAATVNASLGGGTLFNLGGISTLNGTAAGNVSVQAGTLALGAANRLADNATVLVASGATLNLGAFNDIVGALGLNGTLAGTGTLTAAEYDLTGASVNANLGAGNLFQLGGTSVLNGSSASTAVQVQAGTLTLGAANRLADSAVVSVSTGATLNLGANSDTVGALALGGTLAGTGTLTAAQYQLTAATVNANLGAGTLVNMGGISTLTGTAAANAVTVQGGTLRLGASDRLADTATLGIATGATFDLATYNETVASLAGTGTLALGTGRLTLSGAGNSAFGGAITGSGSLDKQGAGTLTLAGTFATTGRFDVSAGTLAFSGSSQGGIRVQGGALIGSGTLGGALTLNSGTFSPGGLATGQFGAINPIGSFTVGSLVATGGSLLFDFGGQSLNFTSDSIRVNGTATLSGGTVAVNALTAAASDYRFNQLYTIVQANALSGTFAN